MRQMWGLCGWPVFRVPRSGFALRGSSRTFTLRPLTRPYSRRSTGGGISTPANRTPSTSALRGSHEAPRKRANTATPPRAGRWRTAGARHRCTLLARARAHQVHASQSTTHERDALQRSTQRTHALTKCSTLGTRCDEVHAQKTSDDHCNASASRCANLINVRAQRRTHAQAWQPANLR